MDDIIALLRRQQEQQQQGHPVPVPVELLGLVADHEIDIQPADVSGELNEEIFVEEIRKYLCLWDTRCRAYKDLTKKTNAWKELSLLFCKEVDYLKKAWKNLKDNFTKCVKRREKCSRSGAAAQCLPKCKLFDQLTFIHDTVTNRPTISNIQMEDFQNTEMLNDTVDSNNYNTEDLEVISTPATSTPTTKRKASATVEMQGKQPKISPVDQALLKALSDDSASRSVPTLTDPDVAFAHSIIPILKGLPAKKNRLAKVDIQKLLIKYEFDED